MLKKLSFVCFGILLSILVGANSASACGELLLASQGVDFGKLSCDASGYVVLDPKSKANLIGYEVNSQKVVKKNSVGGDSFQNDKNKAKVQVFESTSGNDTFRFACKKSPNGFAAIDQNQSNLILSPTNLNTKTELTWGGYLFCPDRPLTDDTDFEFKLTDDSRPAIFDTNGNITDGFQSTIRVPKNKWNEPRLLTIYYTKDDKNGPSTLELSAASKKASSPWPSAPTYKVILKDVIKDNPLAKVSSGFDITFDYRYDAGNVIPQSDRDLIRQVGNEIEATLKENSKTYHGWIQYSGVLPAVPGLVNNGTSARYYQYRQDPINPTANPSGFATLEYADDITQIMSPCFFKNMTTGAFVPEGNVLATQYFFTPGSDFMVGYNVSYNPTISSVCINYPLFGALTPSRKRQVIRHELMHSLGSVGSYQGLPRPTPVIFDTNDNFFKFNGSFAKNGGPALKMDTNTQTNPATHSSHYADGEPFSSNTVMTPAVKDDLGMTLLDKRTLADNGYCVAGINDTPTCN